MIDDDGDQIGLEWPPEIYILQKSLDERFDKYHSENPEIYEGLERLAWRWFHAGRTRCAIVMLFEVLRYETGIRATGDPFKLNNNYRSRYARLIMERNPELEGFFETRVLRS